ncbi:MAG: hypothetical protein SQA66_11450 [Candidatus Fervidibacter sacchari]
MKEAPIGTDLKPFLPNLLAALKIALLRHPGDNQQAASLITAQFLHNRAGVLWMSSLWLARWSNRQQFRLLRSLPEFQRSGVSVATCVAHQITWRFICSAVMGRWVKSMSAVMTPIGLSPAHGNADVLLDAL